MNRRSRGSPGPDPGLPEALLSPQAWPGGAGGVVELVETHISWVFLVGGFAYKVKKPVKLDFLDFSTPALRQHFCEEELRLNRRFAPQIYLGLSRIVATADGLAVDRPGEVVEYAVRMRRFDRREELDTLLARNAVTTEEMERFGRELAAGHEASPPAGPEQPWATPARTLEACRENFAELHRLPGAARQRRVARLEAWTEARFRLLAPSLSRRRDAGRYRECHGDLHCANVVRYDGRLCAFDALEFDPGLHWIDVASDLAFLSMDLRARGHADLAAGLLDGWLTASGDFGALGPLRFYEVYRALVRAKVASIRLSQSPAGSAQRNQELERYLSAAERTAAPPAPRLVSMAGVSGSGKSSLAARLLAPLDAVRLRSDVERKRLCGLAADAGSDGSIYTPEITRRTYARLGELAAAALRDGFSVIVDAANLHRDERQALRGIAVAAGVPFHLFWLSASPAQLGARIRDRAAAGGDPSEADGSVMARQLQFAEPPGTDERGDTSIIDSGEPVDVAALVAQLDRTDVGVTGPR